MFDNPIVNAHGTERLGTAFYILLRYLQLLVFPLQLSCDYSFDAISLHSLTSPLSLLGVVLYAGIGVYALIGLFKKQISAFFAAAFLISISLYSQIIFLIGTFIGERLLYMPSLWFVLGVTTAVSSFFMTDNKTNSSFSWKHASIYMRSTMIVLATFLVWFSIHAIVRNKDWKSDYTLMKADAAKSPRSIRLVQGYAEEIYNSITKGSITPEQLEQRLTLSEEYSKKANDIKPGISAYTNLANICISRKNYACALENHKKIIDLSDDKLLANQNVGNMLIFWAKEESDRNNNIQLALDLLQQALEFKPVDGEIWYGIGLNQFRLGHIAETEAALIKANQLAPTNPTFKNGLVNFYRSQGKNDKADAVQ
jgi:tetratricopeptide (TPR) repeat protein